MSKVRQLQVEFLKVGVSVLIWDIVGIREVSVSHCV